MTDKPQQWVNEVVAQSIPDTGPFRIAELAETVFLELQERDPAMLEQWMRTNMMVFIADHIRRSLSSQRAQVRIAAKKSVFSNYAAMHDAAVKAGTPIPPRPEMLLWTQTQTVNDRHDHKVEHEMTKEDLRFIARRHTVRHKSAEAQAAFYTAVARKIPDGKTIADVYTPEKYFTMWQSVVNA